MKETRAAVRTTEIGQVLKVEIRGEIDHHTAPAVREAIDKEMYVYRPKEVRLDLSEMCFMDSAGLGLIVGRMVTAKEVGCHLVITGADERTLKIFEMAGLERMRGLTIERKSRAGKGQKG